MAIRVLLVDDSPTARQLLAHIVNGADDMQVVGEAINGVQAVQLVEALHPDVVLMDVIMPVMDGLEATREIMHANPLPIVLISVSFEAKETATAFEAINAGALAVLPKPGGPKSPNYEASLKEIRGTLRAMSDVRVIRHAKLNRPPSREKSDLLAPYRPEPDAGGSSESETAPTFRPKFASGIVSKIVSEVASEIASEIVPESMPETGPEIVSIASSTGGPQVLGEIIRSLPATFSLPVVIVQHITPGFVSPLVDWLGSISRVPVRVAQAGESPLRGTIYVAPGYQHLHMTNDHRFAFSDAPANVPHIPSGDVLLESVARHYGSHAVGIVLTGMGADGARGLRAMYEAGAMTIAQDAASCVVFGMPHEAIVLGAVRETLPPQEILRVLIQYSTDSINSIDGERPGSEATHSGKG